MGWHGAPHDISPSSYPYAGGCSLLRARSPPPRQAAACRCWGRAPVRGCLVRTSSPCPIPLCPPVYASSQQGAIPARKEAGVLTSPLMKKTAARAKKKTVPPAHVPHRAAPPAVVPPPVAAVVESASVEDDAPQVFGTMPISDQSMGPVNFFMNLLDESAGLDGINMSMPYEHDYVEDEEEVMEVDTPTGKRRGQRLNNYTIDEDEALVLAWESISLDAVVGTDQSCTRYWQRIEEQYRRNLGTPSCRTLKSLTHRWGSIRECCNRWAGCVAQVERIAPSGAQISDYTVYAQARYKQMEKSKGKPFVFHHCWALLKNNPKWESRNDESPPKRQKSLSCSSSRENDDDDGHGEGSARSPTPSFGRPDGRKKEERMKRKAEMSTYSEKFDEMIKTRKELVAQTIQTKLELAAQKKQDRLARWQEVKENEERKIAYEERKTNAEEHRLALEEKRLQQKAQKQMRRQREEETRIMLMDPSVMNDKARAFWEMTRDEILASRMTSGGGHYDGASSSGDGGA